MESKRARKKQNSNTEINLSKNPINSLSISLIYPLHLQWNHGILFSFFIFNVFIILVIMPRIDLVLKDRLYILKLICIIQMTYSSFTMLIYIFLITLQDWTYPENKRTDVIKFKWCVVVICALDFGNGTLLAFSANMNGIRSKRGIVAWIVLETFLIPISIFLLKELLHKVEDSKEEYSTDLHYSRINIAQICFLLSQYLFIGYALDFIATRKRKIKTYDPNIRPISVDLPTYPQITTTESRHIRLSRSFLFQPSFSKKPKRNEERAKVSNIKTLNETELKKVEMPKCSKNEDEDLMKDEEKEEKEWLEIQMSE